MRRSIASKFIVGGLEGISVSPTEAAILEKFPLRGVTLFKRNIEDSGQLIKLNTELASLRPGFEIAVDQEGGRVSRLRQFAMPGGGTFPDEGPVASCDYTGKGWEDYGVAVGRALKVLGFTTNFAPVADVLTNAKNECIGDRAFANKPEVVAEKAGAFLRGQNKTKVKGVLKHFPGQGDAEVDTHLGAATVDLDEATLFETHVKPFQVLSKNVHGIMTAHSSYPAFDGLPASISHKWITGVLRQKLGFDGLVYSDDFLMHAIPQDDASWKDAIIEGIAAGLDIILVCRYLEKSRQAVETIEAKLAGSKAFADMVESRLANTNM